MKNLAGLMKQAAQMQKTMETMQERLAAASVEGSSGAGMIVVTLSGKGEMRSIRIDAKLLDPAEGEMLSDLIIAAHADARRKMEALAAEEMRAATGGIDLPAGMKLPF